jgi:hypothetical protein
MSGRAAIALVLAALAAVAIYVVTRRHDEPAATRPPPAHTGVDQPAPTAAISAPEAPSLALDAAAAATSPPAPPVTIADTSSFDGEDRDSTWAPVTERALHDRLDHNRGGAKVTAECRSASCQVTLSAKDDRAISAALADIEGGTNRLAGWAKSIKLTAPAHDAFGASLTMIVEFDR